MNCLISPTFIFFVFLPVFTAAVQEDDESFLKFVNDLPKNALSYEKEEIVRALYDNVAGSDASSGYDEKMARINALIPKEVVFQTHLGILFLMKKHWHCATEAVQPFEEQCKKYKKFMEILYEFLFRVYSHGWSVAHHKELPDLATDEKPMFRFEKGTLYEEEKGHSSPLIDAVYILNTICSFLFQPTTRNIFGNNFQKLFEHFYEPFLEDEEQMMAKYFGSKEGGANTEDGTNGAMSGTEKGARTDFGNAMERMSEIAAKIKENGGHAGEEKEDGKSVFYLIGSSLGVIWYSPFFPKQTL